MINKISVSHGSWRVSTPTGLEGCHEIIADDNRVIGMAHEFHDAALMASSKEMFDALVEVHTILATVEDSEVKDLIEDRLAITFEKIVAETDV
jgi:hypothetical protein